MATQSAPQAASTTASTTHPLTPLSSVEIVSAAGIIRSLYPANTSLLFKAVTLQEPEKAATLKYLDAEHAGTALPTGIDRKAFIAYYIRNTVSLRLCFIAFEDLAGLVAGEGLGMRRQR